MRHTPLTQRADPELRPLQVGEDRNGASDRTFKRADDFNARSVVSVRAMAEIEAKNVDAGLPECADHLGA